MASVAVKALLHVAAVPLVLLDFVVWLLTLGPLWMVLNMMKVPNDWARPFSKANINGSLPASDVWRASSSIETGALTVSPFPGCYMLTLYDLLKHAWSVHGKNKAQGIRPLLRWKTDDGFKYPAKVFGTTEYRTHAEVQALATAFGSGLRGLGVQPQPQGDFDSLTGNFKILMYEDTCADWMVCLQGAITQDIVVATAYATLGADAVISAVNEGEVSAIVCNRKAVESLAKRANEMPSLKVIIYTDFSCTPEECAMRPGGGTSSLKVLALDEVIAMGRDKMVDPSPPRPDSVVVIMYTSGSTGKPKGVVVQHKHLLAMAGACREQFGALLDEGSEMYIGYLPLAHILELAAELYFYGMGNCIGYSDPKTLLHGPEKCYPTGGLEEFRPTLMAGVPKVWEGIKKGAEAKLEKSGDVANFLFKVALRLKKSAMWQHRYTPVFDLLIFRKFKNMIGGRMKFTLSGGGAISAEVQEWVRAAFGCPLVQGYGLTETCGGSTIQHPLDLSVGIAGSPLGSIELTLLSEPDITDSQGKPYLSTDTVHADGTACRGRGEVWLRGNSLTYGYYKMPEKTKEEYGTDGWFHTGDIGMMTPTGQLRIVDRKKNLVKLKGGEYVATELMNSTYNMADIINAEAGGVCCYADSSLDRAVAFAQVKQSALLAIASEAGVSGKATADICHDPKVMAAVKAKLDVVAKKANLPPLMHVRAVLPVVEAWTPENGCLTATAKLVPRGVCDLHKKDLEILKKFGVRD